MGQYFLIANLDKKEYIKPHDCGSGAKLWEITVNIGGILVYLTRKSDDYGGGDIEPDECKYAGRWAGDRIITIGDYDSSDLYHKILQSGEWNNISKEVYPEYVKFVEH